MRQLVVAVLVVMVFAGAAGARDIVLSRASGGVSGVQLVGDNLAAKAIPSMSFEAHVGRLTAEEIKTTRGTFTQLSIPGYQHTGIVGAPALPIMNHLVEVPLGAEVEVVAEAGEPRIYKLAELGITSPLYPAQPSAPKDGTVLPFAYKNAAYLAPGFRAEELVTVSEVGQLRHVRLVLLTVAPVAYDPTAGQLEVTGDLKITVNLKGADLAATAKMKNLYGSSAFSFVYRNVLSPATLTDLNRAGADRPATYAIVADRKFENDLKPFIAWKTAKGFRVVVGYTDQIGATSDAVKAWIHGLYNGATLEAPAPTFVLFVGDQAEIPAYKGTTGGHVTELPFVCVTPGDKIPDILTGRFSASNSDQLVPQIAKTLEYEKYTMSDPSFLSRVVLTAGWDASFAREWGWPQINYGLKYYFNAEHGIPTSLVTLTSGSGQGAAKIVAGVSEGCALVNYTAHGSPTSWADPSFSISNINSLQNAGKYPLVIGNCCLTSKFEVATCFAEAWLRPAGKGAIGYIGGTNSTYWDEDLWFGVGYYPIVHPNTQGEAPDKAQTGQGAYDASFEGAGVPNAGLILAGNLAVEQSSSPRKLYYWEVYHLMGDPSLQTYMGVPTDAVVEHPATIDPAATTLELKAPAGAQVGITVNDQLLGGVCVAADGKAVVTLAGLPTEGALQVVVTGRQLKPYTGSIQIAVAPPVPPTDPEQPR